MLVKCMLFCRYALLRSPSLECQGHSLRVSGPLAASGVPLGRLSLSPLHGSYEEVSSDGVVCVLVPQGPVYPRAKVYVPVIVKPNPVYPLNSFTLKSVSFQLSSHLTNVYTPMYAEENLGKLSCLSE